MAGPSPPPRAGRPDLALRRRVLSVPTVVSFGVAAVILAFLVTRFDVDVAATWNTLRSSDPVLYLLAIVVYYLTFLFRGARWRVLLRNALKDTPDERARVPSVARCGGLILVGWFVNSVSWFRLGDAYRAYAYTEDTGTSFAHTAGTVLAERVVDVVMVFGFLLVAAALMGLSGNVAPSPLFLWIGFGMVVAGGAILLAMVLFRNRLARRLPAPLAGAYHRLHAGTIGSFRQLHLVFLLGLLAWLCEFGRLYLVLQAMGLDVGVGLVLFVALASALLTTVPLTPGGLGLVETGVAGLLMLALPRQEAVAAAVLDRSVSYLSVVVFGGLAFAARQVVAARRRSAGREAPAGRGVS